MKKPIKKKYVKYHSDGSMWAKGYVIDGEPDGYFEWFRKDGTIMRSGYFSKGKQVGTWTTYDRKGKIVKVTKMK
jgi:antitoxin component YwqK of YwqJK toxin-antitoxin module